MKAKPLPLPPGQILVNTRTLADRWGVDPRTVLRICRHHQLTEIQLLTGGRILYPLGEVQTLEAEIFKWN